MFVDRQKVVAFRRGFRGPMLQEVVERLQVFQAPVLSRSYLAPRSAQFHEPDMLPRLFAVLPSQDFVSLGEDELRQLRLGGAEVEGKRTPRSDR
jgi:hypothetical protein